MRFTSTTHKDAFNQSRTQLIQAAINRLYRRVIQHSDQNLTHADVLKLFVRPPHRQIVQDVVREAQVEPGSEFEFTCSEDGYDKKMYINVEIDTNDERPGFVFPKYMGNELAIDAVPSESNAKLLEWVKWRGSTGRMWGLVRSVFDALNEQCKSPQEVRYFWPCIVSLMGLDRDLREQADKIRDYRIPSHIAQLPPELRKACADTSAVVTTALLYPEQAPSREGVQVILKSRDYGLDRMPWDKYRWTADLG